MLEGTCEIQPGTKGTDSMLGNEVDCFMEWGILTMEGFGIFVVIDGFSNGSWQVLDDALHNR